MNGKGLVAALALTAATAACGPVLSTPVAPAATSASAAPPASAGDPDVVDLDHLPGIGNGGGPPGDVLAAAQGWAAAHPQSYGGLFLSGRYVYVELVGDAAAELAQIRHGLSDPQWVRAVRAEYTFAQLQALVDRITADQAWVKAQGIQMSAWGPDPYRNRVGVKLTRDDAHWRSLLVARYGGAMLRFDVQAYAVPV